MKFSRIANAISSRCSTSRRIITFEKIMSSKQHFGISQFSSLSGWMMFNEIEYNFNCAVLRWWEGGNWYSSIWQLSASQSWMMLIVHESKCLSNILPIKCFSHCLLIFGWPVCQCKNRRTINECITQKAAIAWWETRTCSTGFSSWMKV